MLFALTDFEASGQLPQDQQKTSSEVGKLRGYCVHSALRYCGAHYRDTSCETWLAILSHSVDKFAGKIWRRYGLCDRAGLDTILMEPRNNDVRQNRMSCLQSPTHAVLHPPHRKCPDTVRLKLACCRGYSDVLLGQY